MSLEGLDENVKQVFIQGEVGTDDGVFLADSLVKIEIGVAHLMIRNSSFEDVLPAKYVVVVWNCLNDTELYEMDKLEHEFDVVAVLYNTSEDPEENKEKNPDEEGGKCAEQVEVIPEVIPDEIQKLIVDCYGSMEEEELVEVKKVLLEYKDVFTIKGEALGRTSWDCHKINVGGTNPIEQQPRRIPLHQVDVVEGMIDEMERNNVIRPSESLWASPVVIVAKKDGSCRFCVDYRKLYAITTKDAYPIPRVDENLDALVRNRWFTSLDLASGYWQVEMAEQDKAKTAFVTRFGLFEWNVMPFGLCNAPAMFQRLMERVLRELQWKTLVLYLDDMVIFSKTFKEHVERLREVFNRFRRAGLKLKLKKCHFFKNKISFLGHQADENRIYTDPEKIEKIKNWGVPKDVHDIRVFTGLTSYYRSFVDGYAQLATCLHELTKKDARFHWDDKCQIAFDSLKAII